MTSAQTPAPDRKTAAAFLTIAQHMAKVGATPIPRNYELFYEALSGHKPDLLQELGALGPQTPQAVLDAIGVRHRLTGQNAIAAEQSRQELADMLNGLNGHVDALFERKTGYADTLGKLVDTLAGRPVSVGAQTLDTMMMKTLLSDMLLHEKNALLVLKAGIEQLGKLRSGVESERRVNIIDRLTGLPNKAAFSARLTALFENDTPRHRSVLMIVELTSLRGLTARVGPEMANRILRRFGVILRKSVKKNDFVARIGDQEFALLFEDVTSENVRSIALRLHDTVEEKLLPRKGEAPTPNILSMTSGIATCEDAASPNEYFAKAEATLLAARKQAEPRIGVYVPPSGRKAGKG